MNKKGFTLVEVLVSLALVSTIAIFLFQIIFIIRDIYAEKNIKSEIYIESSNISNVINKDIYNKDKDGIYIKNINKVSNDEMYITYSDGIKNNIVIDRDTHTITYGNYTVSILDVAKIGNIELYYNYETTETNKNGICYIKIPITHDDYKNDFGIVITYRYDSSKTKINGEVSTRPGRTGYDCNVLAGTTWTFDYTGDVQSFSVPCNGTYKLETWGAAGGDAKSVDGQTTYIGGYGGYSTGKISLNAGDTLHIQVGGAGKTNYGLTTATGGYNGGGMANAPDDGHADLAKSNGSGGGATHIATVAGELKNLSSYKSTGGTNISNEIILVAGGGGGALYYNHADNWISRGRGGHGGGINGTNSIDIYRNGGGTAVVGTGGTQTAGYQFGLGGVAEYMPGGGGGWFGGTAAYGGGGGSGYIANPNLSDKKMVCYDCTTSDDINTKTETNTCVNEVAVADCSKQGNGYAKITLVSYN